MNAKDKFSKELSKYIREIHDTALVEYSSGESLPAIHCTVDELNDICKNVTYAMPDKFFDKKKLLVAQMHELLARELIFFLCQDKMLPDQEFNSRLSCFNNVMIYEIEKIA